MFENNFVIILGNIQNGKTSLLKILKLYNN